MIVNPMTAVTVNEKPASLALPVSESVNFVEKIVTGANAAKTTIRGHVRPTATGTMRPMR